MSYNDLINNLIPADDLHWCEDEQKYVSLSEEEIRDIITRCIEQGLDNLDDVHKMIQWCGTIRVGQLLWKNFLLGSLNVSGFDKDEEPRFIPNKEKRNEY